MAGCGNDYICPGKFTVYRNIVAAADITPLTGLAAADFTRVPEVLSWSLEPSVDEPNSFRTADTEGTRVKPCSGGVEWTVTVATKICITNWLYDIVLDPAEMVNGWYVGGETLPAWWYLSFNNLMFAGANAAPTDHGILLYGEPTPPGISGDNDTDEASGAEFTINISRGPYFPNL